MGGKGKKVPRSKVESRISLWLGFELKLRCHVGRTLLNFIAVRAHVLSME